MPPNNESIEAITYLKVSAVAIRANIRRGPGEELEPVLIVKRGDEVTRAHGAILHGRYRIRYAALPHEQVCGDSVWIEAEGRVELFDHPIAPPSPDGTYLHTNTNIEASNRVAARDAADPSLLAFRPALSVRDRRSGKARNCFTVEGDGPMHLVYARPESGVKPLACGARVFGWTTQPVTLQGQGDGSEEPDGMDDEPPPA